MGQALDRDGNLLGEAFGETKREVFDKLMREHVDAAEIRIRSIEDRIALSLPRYQCHKQVRAAQITAVNQDAGEGGGVDLQFGPEQFVTVQQDWANKHKPTVGGYYVVYGDGYASFSPADAFEGGYTRI